MNPSDVQDVDALSDLWKAERLEYDPFCNDGILLPEVWKLEKPKLAFILKESNDDFCDIRGQAWDPKEGNSRRFWRQINIWAFTIKQFIKPRSDHGDIQAYVDRDWAFIERQISLIAPDILVCGGTFKYIAPRCNAGRLGGRPTISMYHPSYPFASDRKNFDALCEKLRNLPNS